MTVRRAWIVGSLVGLAVGLTPFAVEARGTNPAPNGSNPAPKSAQTVPHAKFVKVVKLNRGHRREAARWRATALRGPDFDVSLQLAAIAYRQDWRHLRRCALSEGYGESRRYHRRNGVSNRQGSGAFSSFQFMRGTFLSTPYAHLDWSRQDVQAHAAAWMFSVGRSREWTGAGC